MSRPSAPLLSWLRNMLKEKGLNTARVAESTGLPRARLRKVLAGTADMTVDELMLLSEALELDPTDLSSAALAEVATAEPQAESEAEEFPRVDPWGNQPEQLFKIAFALGCDFFFLIDAAQLADSGVPDSVAQQYAGRELPIRLDAAYHEYNDPKYSDEGIALTLSFDKLYDCHFPWSSVRQFVMFPITTELTAETEEPPSGPHLRLVT